MNSKLDLRLEVAKIVCQLPETTIDNFHERAGRIEMYLCGDAILPEQDDTMSVLKQLMNNIKEKSTNETALRPYSPAMERYDAVPPFGAVTGIGDQELLKKIQEHSQKSKKREELQ